MMPELFHDSQDPIAKEMYNNSFNNSTVKVEICINLGWQCVQYIKDDESGRSACEAGEKYTFTLWVKVVA